MCAEWKFIINDNAKYMFVYSCFHERTFCHNINAVAVTYWR